MANLVYAGTIDEKVYQRLSERMQDRYDILGSLPDTIEDDWIEDIERLEEELKSFTKPESPADVFSLRYGDFLSVDGDDRGWEVWTKVVARRELMQLIRIHVMHLMHILPQQKLFPLTRHATWLCGLRTSSIFRVMDYLLTVMNINKL